MNNADSKMIFHIIKCHMIINIVFSVTNLVDKLASSIMKRVVEKSSQDTSCFQKLTLHFFFCNLI
jgi:hypothetical protein